jgi:DNA-binding winged helix-turn-helix (wHTH) protein
VPIGAHFTFESFELDPDRRRLSCAGEPVALSERQLDVLLMLVLRAGQIVSKEDLLEAGWKDVAVGDNSLEQVISSLRRLLGVHANRAAYIETVPRRGYRFSAVVARKAPRESDAGLDALLAPHRAFIEGRAALETLDGRNVARAREVFEAALKTVPEHASAHVGLANACVMQFEMTRADAKPDAPALATAIEHAREACRLDPQFGEAWATLASALRATGDRIDAIAAGRRAVTLEPDNWRHHFRLSYASWGEDRLRAAHRTLALLPDFPQAHWLAATVHVARQAFDEAERELLAGLAAPLASGLGSDSRFSSVALHWLLGLIWLSRGDEKRALEEFELELSFENSSHLYARECSANTWYAIGALKLRQKRHKDAVLAFHHAIERVAIHPLAKVGLDAARSPDPNPDLQWTRPPENPANRGGNFDTAVVRAVQLALEGAHEEAAHLVEEGLAATPPGSAGWQLPVEPLLQVGSHPDVWARALALVRNRAA